MSLQDISPDIILLFTFSPQTTFSCNIPRLHDLALLSIFSTYFIVSTILISKNVFYALQCWGNITMIEISFGRIPRTLSGLVGKPKNNLVVTGK